MNTSQSAALHRAHIAVLILLVSGLSGCQGLQPVQLDEWLRGERVAPRPPSLAREDEPVVLADPAPRTDTFALSEDTGMVGALYVITASEEDTLVDIARRYDLGYEEIRAANPAVDPWLPRPGARILLPTRYILPRAPREGIVLNLAALRLFYYPKPGPGGSRVVITHPIGIGREEWPTPMGLTRVSERAANPTWRVPESIRREHAAAGDPLPAVVPPGPDNPLGRHALRLAVPGYLIHGTNKPGGIGMRVSHGCIQLFPEDIEPLFEKVAVGTPVRIVDQPYLAAWDGGVLHLEVHAPLDGTKVPPDALQHVLAKAAGNAGGEHIDWARAESIAKLGRGFPVPVEPGQPAIEDLVASLPVSVREAPAAAEADGAPAGDGQWYVQAGSYRSPHAAHRVSRMLGHMGPPIPARPVATSGYHRVLAGPYVTRAEAEAGARRIKTSLGTETLIVQPDI
jgi:L,D-transpeptidase ErfK/SrfK